MDGSLEREQRQLVRRMSAPGLSSEAQLRYLLQWFGEFSELQREDFLPMLAAAQKGEHDQLVSALAALSCQDKPVSLFQCRIKLFNEWYSTWSEEERERLFKGIRDIDAEFGEKLDEYVTNGAKVNGDHNGISEANTPDDSVEYAVNDNQIVESTTVTNQPTSEVCESAPETSEGIQEVKELNETEDNSENPIIDNNIPVEIVAAS